MMGIIWSVMDLWTDRGRTDDEDVVSNLTSRDKYLIKNSWDVVMKDATGSGVKLFMRLFEIQPKYQEFFPFKSIPYEDLPSNKGFQAHCNIVVHSFASIVSAIDDAHLLKQVAEKVAISHARRNVNQQALKDVKQALIDIFAFMTASQLASWVKLLDFVFQHMENVIIEQQSK